MMGWSPECYIPSFVEIGPVPEIFEGFLPHTVAILVMGQASHHQIFISLMYLKTFIQIGTVVSGKIQFEFLYVHKLQPWAKVKNWPRNDLDLQYSHISIYSIRCQLVLPFRSLAAIISEKSTLLFFP